MFIYQTERETEKRIYVYNDRYVKSLSTQNQLSQYTLECGPMPNVIVSLLNTGGALCSTPQSLADAHY